VVELQKLKGANVDFCVPIVNNLQKIAATRAFFRRSPLPAIVRVAPAF
jgi:hypothetical protein